MSNALIGALAGGVAGAGQAVGQVADRAVKRKFDLEDFKAKAKQEIESLNLQWEQDKKVYDQRRVDMGADKTEARGYEEKLYNRGRMDTLSDRAAASAAATTAAASKHKSALELEAEKNKGRVAAARIRAGENFDGGGGNMTRRQARALAEKRINERAGLFRSDKEDFPRGREVETQELTEQILREANGSEGSSAGRTGETTGGSGKPAAGKPAAKQSSAAGLSELNGMSAKQLNEVAQTAKGDKAAAAYILYARMEGVPEEKLAPFIQKKFGKDVWERLSVYFNSR